MISFIFQREFLNIQSVSQPAIFKPQEQISELKKNFNRIFKKESNKLNIASPASTRSMILIFEIYGFLKGKRLTKNAFECSDPGFIWTHDQHDTIMFFFYPAIIWSMSANLITINYMVHFGYTTLSNNLPSINKIQSNFWVYSQRLFVCF